MTYHSTTLTEAQPQLERGDVFLLENPFNGEVYELVFLSQFTMPLTHTSIAWRWQGREYRRDYLIREREYVIVATPDGNESDVYEREELEGYTYLGKVVQQPQPQPTINERIAALLEAL